MYISVLIGDVNTYIKGSFRLKFNTCYLIKDFAPNFVH